MRSKDLFVLSLIMALILTAMPVAAGDPGMQKWVFPTAGEVRSSAAIAQDGTVYFGNNNTIFAVAPDGNQKWAFTPPTIGERAFSSPAVGADGTVYAGSGDGNLYALTDNGTSATQKWAFTTGGIKYSSPAISWDGNVYIGSTDGNLYAVKPGGNQKWLFPVGSVIDSSPAIGPDGTVYVGSGDSMLYAIFGDSPGLAKSTWPMFHQDPGHNSLSTWRPSIFPIYRLLLGEEE